MSCTLCSISNVVAFHENLCRDRSKDASHVNRLKLSAFGFMIVLAGLSYSLTLHLKRACAKFHFKLKTNKQNQNRKE